MAIKASHPFFFNLLFNSLQFIAHAQIESIADIRNVGIVLVYFNLVVMVGLVYLSAMVLNPRPWMGSA